MIHSFFYYLLFCSGCIWTKGGLSSQRSGSSDSAVNFIDPNASEKDLLELIKQARKNSNNPKGAANHFLLSQAHYMLGELSSDEDKYMEARNYGLDCLRTNVAFVSRLQLTSGRIDTRIMQSLGSRPQFIACSIVVAISWSKWLRLRNSHLSSSDAKSIEAMSGWLWRSVQKADSKSQHLKGWAGYACGLGYSLRLESPQTERKRKDGMKRVEDCFQAALQVSTDPQWGMDYVEYGLIPTQQWTKAEKILIQIDLKQDQILLLKKKSLLVARLKALSVTP